MRNDDVDADEQEHDWMDLEWYVGQDLDRLRSEHGIQALIK